MSISVETLALAKKYTDEHGGGGGGTTNYNQLTNKPKINGVTVEGEKSFEDYGFPDLTESVKAAEAAKQGAEAAKGQAETLFMQAQQSATQAGESATAAEGHASTAHSAATVAQSSAEAAAQSAQEAKGVIPPTDTAQKGDVPTWDGENVVWEPPTGGTLPNMRKLGEINLTTDMTGYNFTQDTNGQSFSCEEVILVAQSVNFNNYMRIYPSVPPGSDMPYLFGFSGGKKLYVTFSAKGNGYADMTVIFNESTMAKKVFLTKLPGDKITGIHIEYPDSLVDDTTVEVYGR